MTLPLADGMLDQTARRLAAMAVLALSSAASAQGIAGRPAADASRAADGPAAAIVGRWRLNFERTHYGPGVDRRLGERFACAARGVRIECTITSARADGRVVRARFAAGLDGTGSPVAGIADVDEVRLRPASPGTLDATFLLRGAPVFAYRAYRAEDGRSLAIVTVDPTSRAALSTVVMYDRE